MPTPISTAVDSSSTLTIVNGRLTRVSNYKVQAEFGTGVTNGYQLVDPKTVFTAADKWVYLVYQVANVPADSSFQITWIAVDVPGIGHNFELQHDHCDCNYKSTADRVGYFALGSPPGGFLTGSYSADLYLNESLIGSFPFEVH